MNEIIHCRDCKYYEMDVVDEMAGFPIIVAHNICNRWGRGCKTNQDGFCHLAEPKMPQK